MSRPITNRTQAVLVAGALGLWVSACVTPNGADTFLDVPFVPQDEGFCGVAALDMVYAFYALDPSVIEQTQQVFIPSLGGTIPELLVESAQAMGLEAHVRQGDLAELKNWLTMQHPPIVYLGPPSEGERGHFVVVTGVAANGSAIRFHSGYESNRTVRTGYFLRKWKKGAFTAVIISPSAGQE